MTTLNELIEALNLNDDLYSRADDFLYATTQQINVGNTANGTALLNEAVNILRDNVTIRDDLLISQIAYEFVCLGQMNRAGNAVNLISDESIKNETLARMAIERAKTDLGDAGSITGAITDSTVKDATIGAVAVTTAQAGNLAGARNIVQAIVDADYRDMMDRTCIRESSKGL